MCEKTKRTLLLVGEMFLLVAASYGFALRAGVAKVDITPPVGVPMWGYFPRKIGAQGTLDALYARVLVLEAGETRIAIVGLDLGRSFGPRSLQRLRDSAKQSSRISCLLANASHTHAGPVVQDEYPNGVPAWETTALTRIEKAVEQATSHLIEVRLGTGYGIAYIGGYRHIPRNETRIPDAPVDPTVSVLRVDSAGGKPIAIVVTYACHPEFLAEDNLKFSADFPGAAAKTVESGFDGQPLCIFLQGAAGDINAYYKGTELDHDRVKMIDWAGQRLGQEAVRLAKLTFTQAAPDANIDFADDLLSFRARWNPEQFRDALLKAIGSNVFDVFAPSIKQEFQVPVTIVLINKRIALMSMPGEPYVDFQIEWRKRCPVPDAFFLGYTNGYFGYFPTIYAASVGGYGRANATTWLEVGAGERMLDHAIIRTYEMLGRLSDIPEESRK